MLLFQWRRQMQNSLQQVPFAPEQFNIMLNNNSISVSYMLKICIHVGRIFNYCIWYIDVELNMSCYNAAGTQSDRQMCSEGQSEGDRSTLPVLLTFLKLPKLLSFHILRLAALEEAMKKNQRDRLINVSRLNHQFNITSPRITIFYNNNMILDIWYENLPSAWPVAASPFWFMLFFLRCFFLSVTGEAQPTSLVEEELETPSTAESRHKVIGECIYIYICIMWMKNAWL